MSTKSNRVEESADRSRPAPPPSLDVSISVDMKRRIAEILEQHARKGILKGESVVMYDNEDFRDVVSTLHKVMEDGRRHTITPIELSTLNAELASLRLKLNLFESDKEKSAFVKHTLENDIVRMRKQIKEDATARATEIAEHLIKQEETKKQLDVLKNESGRLRKALAEARARKDEVAINEAIVAKDENSSKITSLNNALQEVNSLKESHKAARNRYEAQLLSLTNELNFLKSRENVGDPEGGAWSKVAAKAGNAPVNLYTTISKSLSSRSKALLSRIDQGKPDDYKNKVFWVHAALSMSQSAVLKGYKLFFDGLLEDMRAIEFESRKAFGPVVDAVISAMRGEVDLTQHEFDALLDRVDTTKIRMAKPYRKKGIMTLADFTDSGRDVSKIVKDDLSSTEGGDTEKLRFVIPPHGRKLTPREPIPEEDDGSVLDTDPYPQPRQRHQKKSAYFWFRRQVLTCVNWLSNPTGSRDRARQKTRFSVRCANWLHRKMGIFGVFFSLPIAVASFVTGNSW